MTEAVVIVGAGGFAREVLDVVDAINKSVPGPLFKVLGVVDPNPSITNLALLKQRGVPYLGTDEHWFASQQIARFVLGIGDPSTRRRIDERYEENEQLAAPALIHPLSQFGGSTHPKVGSVICGGVHISTNVFIDKHVHLNPNATIGNDVTLMRYVSVNPGAIISNEALLEEGSLVGAGAYVAEKVRIGSFSTIGASSCVLQDVAAGAVVKGVPAY